MWSSTVGLVNGKYRYLTAETFGFKVNSNGQQLKRRQQWTIEPFPENTGPDGSISSAASVSSSHCPVIDGVQTMSQLSEDPANSSTCIMTLSNGAHFAGFMRNSNGSNNGSDQSDACDEEHENVAIKSHLNKYLAVDSFGNVTCDSDEKSENARFTITICSMSQGKSKEEHIFWAFKNVERGYYLGTTEDGMICCNAKMPKSRAELWYLHLLPARGASFFALKSLGRKRFARVCNDELLSVESKASIKTTCNSQIQLDANISWGPETLFQFKYFEGGRYALLTSDNKYLNNEGKCIGEVSAASSGPVPPNECLFTLEYHSGYLAFRDSFGHYLAAAGRSSVLRSRSIGVSRDELFMFEPVPIQVSIKAVFNNRWVSIKQGVDVTANQIETTSKFETFQLTYHKQTQLWSIMTHDCNFWTISKNTNTVCVCRPADYEALTRGQFKLVWSQNDATFSLKYFDHLNNQAERWILARKSGQLYLGCSQAAGKQEAVRFIMRFQNRRLLNLRPIDGSGFVGLKNQTGAAGSKQQLEANKTSPDSIQIEYSELPACLTSQNQLVQMTAASDYCNGDNNCVIETSTNSKVISMFNVKLNSTKKGQNIFAESSAQQQTAKSNQQADISSAFEQVTNEKQRDCSTIDSNNNSESAGRKQTDNGGGVESAAAPSVASIISTFSNIRLNSAESQQQQQSRSIGSHASVSKLASSFEANAIGDNMVDSVASSNSSNNTEITPTANGKLGDQIAQSECCYLKTVTNSKYLVVGFAPGASASGDINGNSTELNAICDATNKACAQSWILELRSHNSIAIRASDTQAYMQLGTNGTIYLSRCDSKEASLWEF